MDDIDRKFTIKAVHMVKNTEHSEADSVLFLAKDKLLPKTLGYYRNLCLAEGVGENQIKGVDLLIGRVKEFQKHNPELCKLPDIDDGDEFDQVCSPNTIEEDFLD